MDTIALVIIQFISIMRNNYIDYYQIFLRTSEIYSQIRPEIAHSLARCLREWHQEGVIWCIILDTPISFIFSQHTLDPFQGKSCCSTKNHLIKTFLFSLSFCCGLTWQMAKHETAKNSNNKRIYICTNNKRSLYFDVSWFFTAIHICFIFSVRDEINSRGANSKCQVNYPFCVIYCLFWHHSSNGGEINK